MLDTDRLISFTRDIVRIPSLSGEEAKVARRIEGRWWRLGLIACGRMRWAMW